MRERGAEDWGSKCVVIQIILKLAIWGLYCMLIDDSGLKGCGGVRVEEAVNLA